MTRATLEGVKVGDKLKVMQQWSSQYYEYVVERVTKTLAVCNHNTSFRIDSGLQVGTGSMRRSNWATFLTDDDRAAAAMEARIKAARNAVGGIHINAATLAAAEAFIEACTPKA